MKLKLKEARVNETEAITSLAEADPCFKLSKKYFSEQSVKDAYDYLLGNYETELRENNVKEVLKGICEDKALGVAKTGVLGVLSSIVPGGLLSYMGEEVPEGMFRDAALESITLPSSILRIDKFAFYNCSSLASITVPDSLTRIGGDAFGGCVNLSKIYITDIAAWCEIFGLGNLLLCGSKNKEFYLNSTLLTNLVIPDDVASIGESAFDSCSSLTSVTIGNGVKSIGYGAFWHCTGLLSVMIPDNVTSIDGCAFYGCNGLTNVTIGNGVTSIGESAFWGCKGLTSITIPHNVTSIGGYAFWGCENLKLITFQGTKKQWRAIVTARDKSYRRKDLVIRCTDGDLVPEGTK